MTSADARRDPPLEEQEAMVLFSGGQDSSTCLAWALSRFGRVRTVGFEYGQRHAAELRCRGAVRAGLAGLNPLWAERLGEDVILPADIFRGMENALTSDLPVTEGADGAPPSTFVPGRNLVFLLHAGILAWRIGIRHLVIGVSQADFSGYPDCRDDSVRAMQLAMNLGMDARFRIHAPLMDLDKAATWDLAESLGGEALTDLIEEESHTCYLGERGIRHAWGYGCGECPACVLRAAGHRRRLERRGGGNAGSRGPA